jgi:hypothetical protein
MKKHIITFISSLALLCTVSCNDWLDLESYTRIVNDGEGVKTLDEAGYRLNAIYSMLRAYECYGARMTYYGDACSEDMQAVGNTKRVASYYTFRFTADNSPSSFWTNFYEIINNVNLLLDGIDNLTGLSDADELTRKDYKGQALTIRALAYFDLTRLYGYPYQKDNGASWGVPLLDKSVDSNYKPKRNTVAECYSFIITDLTTAESLMKPAKNNGKLNKWGALALLSRVYLYKGDDGNALQTAKDAISGAESNGYRLWTNAEYNAAWATEFGHEVLWEIPITSTENVGNEAIGYLVAPKGYDDIVLSDDWTINLMGSETNDIRYQCIINNTTDNSKSGNRYMWKYPLNSGESAQYLANIKVLRLSEVYLIAAEAAARKGNANADAVKYLDPIVKRGDNTKTVEGTTVTLDRVLEERRKELVGEGHRFFDVIRNGKHITRSQGLTFPHLPSIEPEAWNFDWNYYKVVLAVPKVEMDANENMKDQQNPTY